MMNFLSSEEVNSKMQFLIKRKPHERRGKHLQCEGTQGGHPTFPTVPFSLSCCLKRRLRQMDEGDKGSVKTKRGGQTEWKVKLLFSIVSGMRGGCAGQAIMSF
jgi:hypothetical protein